MEGSSWPLALIATAAGMGYTYGHHHSHQPIDNTTRMLREQLYGVVETIKLVFESLNVLDVVFEINKLGETGK